MGDRKSSSRSTERAESLIPTRIRVIVDSQNQLLTNTDLEIALSSIRTELAVLKWMMGVLLAGVLSLILKTFF